MIKETEFQIDEKLKIGLTTLKVKDLAGMVDYYTQAIGLSLLEKDSASAVLGIKADNLPILKLIHKPNGTAYPNATGLFHLAILLPTRADLGHWLKHFAQTRQLDGAGDHLVSEALYLYDPEGNGLEIYRDRPRSEWPTGPNGKIKMDTLAVDIPAVLAEAPDKPFQTMPSGTMTGHVHLQVDDVSKAQNFYHTVLGFETTEYFSDQAGFFGAGGYHHHIGANVWRSRGAAPPPADALGLDRYELIFSSQAELDNVIGRLNAAGTDYVESDAAVEVRDPASNLVILKS
ncbi:MAG: VOC family protein [Chloroflexota bacterium]